MGIFIVILVLLVWISPYWWIDKCSKENVELAFVGISVFFAFAIISGGWQFGLGVIILSIHLIIAYFREFSDWGAGNVFSGRKSSGSRSGSRSDSGSCDMDGDYLSYHQEQAIKDYWDNIDSTHSWNDRPDIYDHEGNIDYDKVDQANQDMNAEINGRVEN